jgi:catechol 2,3-dioxygenase-like lactoylglutathione lyase family enzyme
VAPSSPEPMPSHLAAVSLIVRDYDEAIAWYTGKLGFTLVEDTALPDDKRWVVIAPPGSAETRLVLARAVKPGEIAAVGQQGAGRVWLFLQTDDFARDHRDFTARGVRFSEAPRQEGYGTVAVFEDLYGNRWDLIQPATPRDRR